MDHKNTKYMWKTLYSWDRVQLHICIQSSFMNFIQFKNDQTQLVMTFKKNNFTFESFLIDSILNEHSKYTKICLRKSCSSLFYRWPAICDLNYNVSPSPSPSFFFSFKLTKHFSRLRDEMLESEARC